MVYIVDLNYGSPIYYIAVQNSDGTDIIIKRVNIGYDNVNVTISFNGNSYIIPIVNL